MFKRATGYTPFRYQEEIASSRDFPSVLEVPTGLGKTAAAILGWLWRRRFAEPGVRETTPRRLVYCLPMRVLVEQTRDNALIWLNNLGLLEGVITFEERDVNNKVKKYDPWGGQDDPEKIRVHLLMGGDIDRDWDMYPERDAILIGTQDMLLSRALNRGYAMSRFRWPVQFGLLNNDCLWVMDEVQLMGNGLATTTQLQAFRRIFSTAVPVRSLWMSATMHEDWIKTVDFDAEMDAPGITVSLDDDRGTELFRKRFEAVKHIHKAPFEVNDDGREAADLAKERHTPGSLTLVVVNTVKRAQAVYSQLDKMKNKKQTGLQAELVLLHSRFRQMDRDRELSRLLARPGEHGTIAVCTQVIEAGVDISARTLITELAPWSSLVQRFGRCNRYGECEMGEIVWIPYPDSVDEKKTLPYDKVELATASDRLNHLTDVGPSNLPKVIDPLTYTHVVRRKDMVELFDTTPDLAGADIDVSRFIRESDEHDVHVFWRDFPETGPSVDEKAPAREELCTVPVNKDLNGKKLWRWDHLERKWIEARSVYPGLVLMMRSDEGGYSETLGWTSKEKWTKPVSLTGFSGLEGNDDDPKTYGSSWQEIEEHTDRVIDVLLKFQGDGIAVPNEQERNALLEAAKWHDAGKAHHLFQQAVPDSAPYRALWAKAGQKLKPYGRKGFRHELASALAMLAHRKSDLSVYLAAAHHGKVRLSIRSLPHESRPPETGRRFARGIWEGDVLPNAQLCTGTVMPETFLRLSYMELGEDPDTGPSWLERMLNLRDTLGPFRLAFLESLLRIADWRASGGSIEGNQEEHKP